MKTHFEIEKHTGIHSADQLGLLVVALHECVKSAFGKEDFDLEDTKQHLWR